MREAMNITDLAVRTFQNSLHERVTETERYTTIVGEVNKVGGEVWRSSTLVSGERTKVPHGGPMRHPSRTNKSAMVEIGGLKHGYVRRRAVPRRSAWSASRDRISTRPISGALENRHCRDQIGRSRRCGGRRRREVIERAGRLRSFRHRTGNQTGIHWTECGNVSQQPRYGRDSRVRYDLPHAIHSVRRKRLLKCVQSW